ncbi:uncharacterized protein EV154DRAFT_483021 [Mucor mucedo]|uniref:uncharacterized protein n=1 Tax=Mucor mucedo TaxID=29922 RepID=UPI00221F7DC7|nr:uncharacterized protein EV154DRAFT_483021 [Mucor mucedo]KAI7889580.1 hypothetical protein EV154DRAFT_483021 [Mucor mucedo]
MVWEKIEVQFTCCLNQFLEEYSSYPEFIMRMKRVYSDAEVSKYWSATLLLLLRQVHYSASKRSGPYIFILTTIAYLITSTLVSRITIIRHVLDYCDKAEAIIQISVTGFYKPGKKKDRIYKT